MQIVRKRWFHYLVFALLATAILGPLLLPGYILSLDMVFAPNLDHSGELFGLSESITARTPLYTLLQALNVFIPSWILQKAILLLVFFLAGVGAYRLFPGKGIGAYYAGVFYVVNPFTYIRLMAGQWPLLLAYALVPFAVRAFLDLLDEGGMKNVVKLVILMTITGVALVHFLLLLVIVFAVVFIVYLVRNRHNRSRFLSSGKDVVLSVVFFIFLNIFWLVPVLTGNIMRLERIGLEDFNLFAPNINSLIDLAAMYGFWRGGYLDARDFIVIWPLFFVIIPFLAMYGLLWGNQERPNRKLGVSLAIVYAVAFPLAVGASFEITGRLLEWLSSKAIIFSGFRDSHKYVALFCLGYAYLGGLGLMTIFTDLKQQGGRALKWISYGVIISAFILPLIYSFTIFGTWGQVKPTDYPDEWYEVNDILNQDQDDFNVLVLPWHLYMDYTWLPNKDIRLANPARQFFDKPVIIGDNIEAGNEYSDSMDPVSRYVEYLLLHPEVENLGELLVPLNVKYVLLMHEVDYGRYDYLFHQEDLSVSYQGERITVLRNGNPVSRAYGVDNVVYIKDLDDYLDLSQTQNVADYLYLFGGETEITGGSLATKVDVIRNSPVSYHIAGDGGRYTIFTLPQNTNPKTWEYEGQPAIENLGFAPAFAPGNSVGELVYTRFFRVYLPSYFVSLTTLLIILFILLRSWRNGTNRGNTSS
ncbi:hypothetical protein ACFLWU_01640 [Chloroflexota bacterium]